jgi:hypothetical protein
MGRWECSGINRRDTGKHLFIRRIFPSDHDCTSESVMIDYSAKVRLETFEVPALSGRGGGRYGAADAGQMCGSIHSHVGGDRVREMSPTDLRNASANTGMVVPAGRPYLSVIATAGEGWSEGYPFEDWDSPTLDFRLVFSDRRVVKPNVHLMTETEWECEEGQRELSATANAEGGN